MPALWERRNKAAAKLESAQVKLVKAAREHRLANEKKIAKLEKKGKPVPESLRGPANPDLVEEPTGTEHVQMISKADQLVPRSQRPTMRLKPSWAPFSLGFLGIGKKVDTIEWAQQEIQEVLPKLEAARDRLRKDAEIQGVSNEEEFPPLNSAFILFNQQIAANIAVQCLAHNQPSVVLSSVEDKTS